MSDYNDPYALGAVPTARVLEQDTVEHPKGWFGDISQFPRATAARVSAVRQNLPEVADENLDRSVEPWVDSESGLEYELVRSWLNIIDPAESGATAFVVSDGWIVGLRPAGHEDVAKSVHVGNMVG